MVWMGSRCRVFRLFKENCGDVDSSEGPGWSAPFILNNWRVLKTLYVIRA